MILWCSSPRLESKFTNLLSEECVVCAFCIGVWVWVCAPERAQMPEVNLRCRSSSVFETRSFNGTWTYSSEATNFRNLLLSSPALSWQADTTSPISVHEFLALQRSFCLNSKYFIDWTTFPEKAQPRERFVIFVKFSYKSLLLPNLSPCNKNGKASISMAIFRSTPWHICMLVPEEPLTYETKVNFLKEPCWLQERPSAGRWEIRMSLYFTLMGWIMTPLLIWYWKPSLRMWMVVSTHSFPG